MYLFGCVNLLALVCAVCLYLCGSVYDIQSDYKQKDHM